MGRLYLHWQLGRHVEPGWAAPQLPARPKGYPLVGRGHLRKARRKDRVDIFLQLGTGCRSSGWVNCPVDFILQFF